MCSSAHADKLIFAATQARIQGPHVLLENDSTATSTSSPTSAGLPASWSTPYRSSEAIYDSWDKPVQPRSLYLQQLTDRLGPRAAKDIGY
jgi:hypothetical protein